MDRRSLAKIGAGCTIVVVIPTVILGWWAISWARGLAEWSDRAEQFPTVSDLRGDAIPDDENAALVYRQAWEALDLSEEQERLLRTSDDPEALARILDANREALAIHHRASQMAKCRFEPVPDEEEPLLEFPHIGQLRTFGRLLGAQVITAVASGDLQSALAAVEGHAALCAHLLQAPYGDLEYVSARSHLSHASGSLERVLSTMSPPPSGTTRLRSLLNELRPDAALEFTLKMEMAEGLRIIDYFEAHPKEEVALRGERISPSRGAIWSGLMELNRVTYVREMNRLMDLWQHPWREIADAHEELPRHNPAYLFTFMLLPAFELTPVRDEIIANREMMIVALDIAAFADEHGRLPESLGELPEAEADDYAADPFSGEQLRYRPDDAGGYRLWSIGRNLRDNGGITPTEAHQDPDTGYAENDLVFGVAPAT